MTYDNHSIHPSIQKPLNELDRPQVAGQLKTRPEGRKDRKMKRQKDEKTEKFERLNGISAQF